MPEANEDTFDEDGGYLKVESDVTANGRSESYMVATTPRELTITSGSAQSATSAPAAPNNAPVAAKPITRKLSKKELAAEKQKAEALASQAEVEMDEHKLTVEEVAARYKTDPVKGLTSAQAAEYLERDGPNALSPPPTVPEWKIFLGHMVGGFSTLLWIGAILCFVAFGIESGQAGIGEEVKLDNVFLGSVLALVVIITGVFSYFQEKKSSDTMKKFAKMVPKSCIVYRDGNKIGDFDPANLVVGDVIDVSNGNKCPADIRIIDSTAFKVDNSSLTGESEPQKRSPVEQPELNRAMEAQSLAFFTTNAVNGNARGIVIRTGDDTIIGQIKTLVGSTDKKQTPIAKEIDHFILIITSVAVILGVTFFFLMLSMPAYDFFDAIIFLIGIIVANVPEGLLATVTVSLTLCAMKMSKKSVLVKNLESVETLGSTSCICSDKTGTLTQNKMTVAHIFYDNTVSKTIKEMKDGIFENETPVTPSDPTLKALWTLATLGNVAAFMYDEESTTELPHQERKTVGDATESGILKWADGFASTNTDVFDGYYKESPVFRPANKKVLNIPFNSKDKIAASVHEQQSGADELLFVLKGAPERVIDRCDKIMIDGETVEMTKEHRDTFEKGYVALGAAGERVIGFAHEYLPTSEFPKGFEFSEEEPYNGLIARKSLTFVGLTALIDPPREAVPAAVRDCQSGGIQVIMVTGDHAITAKAIAQNIGIIVGETGEDIAAREGVAGVEGKPKFDDLPKDQRMAFHDRAPAQVVNGEQLMDLSDEDLDRVLQHNELVFARTSPQQKLQIVQGCQRNGKIVAVTGDGVNDSPALKAADIGVAMGIAGSDVTKEAADLILMNDDFSSIVTGVKEGRIVFDNLKKSIAYTLTSNIPEISPFLMFIFLEIPMPLSTVMILAIDLGTDMYPAISMAYEGPEADIMDRKPRNPIKDRLVGSTLIQYTYMQIGIIQATAGFFCYFVVMSDSGFWPSRILGLGSEWDNKGNQGLNDSYGNEWSLLARKNIERGAQTSYFVSIVVVQWADLIICKTRVLSVFQQGMRNMTMNKALVFESVLAIIITYVPGFDSFLGTQPLEPIWFCVPALTFSLLIWVYDECRKYLIRKHRREHDGKAGFVERLTYY